MKVRQLLKPLALAALLAAGGAQAQTVLKIGYATAANSHYGVGSTTFCDEIEKGTQGRYKCQQFPSSALGGEREMIEAVQLGTQDLVNTSTGPLGNFVPEVKIVDIPFLFRDYDHARKVMDGPIGQDLLKAMQAKGLIGLAWYKGRDPAIGWIVLGFLPAGAMAIFPLAQRLDWVDESTLTRHGLVLGTTLQLPILFHALVRRASRRRETGVRASQLHHSDALTGLDDRRTLVQRLDDALARSRDLRHQCAVLLVRLTNHPEMAEELGRETANRALVLTASLLRQCATDIDLAARVGEHDFALLIEGPTTGEAALARAQQIVARGLQEAKALPRSTTLRFHVAVALLPDHELNARRCLKWLDEACEAMRADPRKAIRAINF